MSELMPFVLCGLTAQFAGEDPVVALEAALQFEDTRESMQAFCVGQYMEVPVVLKHNFFSLLVALAFNIGTFYHFQPNQETVTTPDLSSLSSPLIDTERNMGLLLGLHASYLAKSTALSPMEIECASRFNGFTSAWFKNSHFRLEFI